MLLVLLNCRGKGILHLHFRLDSCPLPREWYNHSVEWQSSLFGMEETAAAAALGGVAAVGVALVVADVGEAGHGTEITIVMDSIAVETPTERDTAESDFPEGCFLGKRDKNVVAVIDSIRMALPRKYPME